MASRTLLELIKSAWLATGRKLPVPLSYVAEWRHSHPMYPPWCSLYARFYSGSTLAVRSAKPFTGPEDVWRDLGNSGPMPDTFPAELEAALDALKTEEIKRG